MDPGTRDEKLSHRENGETPLWCWSAGLFTGMTGHLGGARQEQDAGLSFAGWRLSTQPSGTPYTCTSLSWLVLGNAAVTPGGGP